MSKVVLRSDVKGLGKRGDIVDVADGYARNFLLPRSLAMAANPGSMSQAQAMRTARDIKDAKNRDSSETIARTLVPAVIKIVAKAKEGRLFGSVAEKDIVEAVKTQTGVVLERRTLHMSEHIKTTGTHSVTVRLHSDVQFAVTVEVTSA
jgi:large subunit ribosomal protein L9